MIYIFRFLFTTLFRYNIPNSVWIKITDMRSLARWNWKLWSIFRCYTGQLPPTVIRGRSVWFVFVSVVVYYDAVTLWTFINTLAGWCLGTTLVTYGSAPDTIYRIVFIFGKTIDRDKSISPSIMVSLCSFCRVLWKFEILIESVKPTSL